MGKERGALRVPVHKRILLLLWDNMSSEEDYEAPEIITQQGIGRELGLRQTHVSRALSELSNDGLVRSKTSHVRGEKRRKKVYFLTKKGTEEVKRTIEELGSIKVPVRRRDHTLKLLSIRKVIETIARKEGRAPTMHDLLTRHMDGSEVHFDKGSTKTPALSKVPINRYFFGRNAELEIISKAVERKNTNLVCIISIAGQGKTSLLANFASGIKDRPLTWTNIDEWTRPMSVLEEWAMMLDGLGRSRTLDHIRGPKEPVLDNAVSLLIKDLEGTGAVLILDDVHKSPGVQELISILKQRMPPGTDATLIAGTRVRSDLYSRKDMISDGKVVEIELRGLDEKSAFELLRESGVPEEEHKLAYKLTQGHPLALELYSSGFDLDGYLWEEVTRSLTERERKVLELTSIYLQPVPAEALFPGEKPDMEVLHSLNEKVLLRRYSDGTYSIHDILRDHLREGLSETDTGRYLDRALSFLSRMGSDSDVLHYIALLTEHDRKELGSVLLREGELLVGKGHDHILELVPRIDPFSLKGTDMVRYLILFSDLNQREGDTSSAEVKLDRALEECDRVLKRTKDENRRSEILALVSRILYRSGEISRKKGILSEHLKAQKKNVTYNRQYGNKAGLGKALNNLAMAYMDRGELQKALTSLKEAMKALEESGDPASRAFVEASIADIYITRRDHNKAKIYLSAASSCQPKLPSIKGKLKRRTGRCWLRMGEIEEAYIDLTDAYSSLKESGDQLGSLKVLLDLYEVELGRGEKDRAIKLLTRVSSGLDSVKSKKEGVRALRMECLRTMYEHALRFDPGSTKKASVDLADAIMKNLGPKVSIVYINNLAQEMKDPELILPLMESFERISWSRGYRSGSLVVSLKRARILMGKGDEKKAKNLLERIEKKASRTGFRKASRKAAVMLSRMK